MERGDFTEVAGAYAASRPGYPATLVDRLVRSIGLGDGDAVVEIGAGTGLFTRALAGRGLSVRALEPNRSMREQAPVLDGVRFETGSFSEPGLTAGSTRWIVAAQSFHFADAERDLPGLVEALEPGGAFSIVGNVRDADHPAMQALAEVTDRHVPEFAPAAHVRDPRPLLELAGMEADDERLVEAHAVPMHRERFVAMVSSFNLLAVAAGAARMAALLTDLDRTLRAAGLERWELPLTAHADTARRPDGVR